MISLFFSVYPRLSIDNLLLMYLQNFKKCTHRKMHLSVQFYIGTILSRLAKQVIYPETYRTDTYFLYNILKDIFFYTIHKHELIPTSKISSG